MRVRIEWPSPGGINQAGPKGAVLTYKGPNFPVVSVGPDGPWQAAQIALQDQGRTQREVIRQRRGANDSGFCGPWGCATCSAMKISYHLRSCPGIRGVKVRIRRNPIGIFLELEGGIAAIDRAARLSGVTPGPDLRDRLPYGALYIGRLPRREENLPICSRSTNKKIALSPHSFLDKDSKTVYLLRGSFYLVMTESEERDPFPGRKRLSVSCSETVRLIAPRENCPPAHGERESPEASGRIRIFALHPRPGYATGRGFQVLSNLAIASRLIRFDY